MNSESFLEQLSAKINAILPKELPGTVRKNVHALIEASFAKLDLVTREEFDAQKEVLLKTRLQVEQLKKQLALLDKMSEGQ